MDKKFIEDFDKKRKSHKNKRGGKDSSGPASSSAANINNKRLKQTKSKSQIQEEPDDLKQHQNSAQYRDRARERREGINKDFELDPDDLQISNPILNNIFDPDNEEQALDEKERRLQLIEESKYLGGDVEHTHLVKGLDFALLEKVKNDQKTAEKLAGESNHHHGSGLGIGTVFGDGDSGGDSEEEEFRAEAILAANSASSSKRQLIDIEKIKTGKSTEVIPCRTALARRILNVLDERWPDKSELFLPGRMSYIIPIDEDLEEDTSVITVLRSKSDAAAAASSTAEQGMETEFGLEQVMNIIKDRRQGRTNSATNSAKKKNSWESDDLMNDYNY